MQTIFLTGATGFVGAYLARYLLLRGYAVRALRRRDSPMHLLGEDAQRIEWVEGDLLDSAVLEEAMQGVDTVYHSAAFISYHAADAEKMLRINAQGTANMVNAALFAGVRRFLHVSSIAALGRKEFVQHFDEGAVWENNRLNTNYGISKFKAECEAWRGSEEGLQVVIINPSVILGAGYWHWATGQFWQRVEKGLSFYPKGATGFVDVRDVALSAIALMEGDIAGERYIVSGSDQPYYELFAQIAKGLGKRAPRFLMRAWMGALAWRWEALRARLMGTAPAITPDVVQMVQNSFTYSHEKLLRALPKFAFTPFEQTIAETSAAFRQSQIEKKPFGLLPLETAAGYGKSLF